MIRMTPEQMLRELAALPPAAQQQVADFVAFLRMHYRSPQEKPKELALEDEPFVGMWRDRQDMQDSNAWVRDRRRQEWN